MEGNPATSRALHIRRTINPHIALCSRIRRHIGAHSRRSHFLISAEEWASRDDCGSHVRGLRKWDKLSPPPPRHSSSSSNGSSSNPGKAGIHTDHVRELPRNGRAKFRDSLSVRDGEPFYAVTNNINWLLVHAPARLPDYETPKRRTEFATFNAISRSRKQYKSLDQFAFDWLRISIGDRGFLILYISLLIENKSSVNWE